jgi:tetratricopeptide (TPR) repeat protein
MEYFDAALKIRKGLADLDKSDDVLQSNLATSYREIGRLYERRGDLDAAIEQYGTAIGIRDLLLQKDPANATWQVSLAPLYTELGAIYRRKGELSQALAQYRKAYQLRRQIAQRDLSIAARQRAYANTGMAIADLLLRLNQDLDDAESFYRGAIETLDEFRPRYDQDVFLCYVGVGDVLKARAEIDAALADYRRAAAIAEEAVTKGAASGTTSVPWVRNLRTAYFRTGELLIDQGHKEKAIEHYQKSLEFMQRTRYPENAGWSALLQALETEITKLKT